MAKSKFTVDLKPYKAKGRRVVSLDCGFFSYRTDGGLPNLGEMSPSLRRAVIYHQKALAALTEEMSKADLLSFARTFSEVRSTVEDVLDGSMITLESRARAEGAYVAPT